jgi:hypothetical protein
VQRIKTFLVVCFSILTLPLWAQTKVPVLLINSRLGREFLLDKREFPLDKLEFPLNKEVTLLHPQPVWNGGDWLAAMRQSGSYMNNLGYFCRKEVEIEKMTRLPLRFRLGSLQEVNRLEGKPGW